MFNLFKKRSHDSFLHTDIHSHLLPGIDDGVQSVDESILIIKELNSLGINRIVTTPHIMSDFYPNTPEIILEKLELVRKRLEQEGISVELYAAAEYYLDDGFVANIEKSTLLTFGEENFILVEMPFLNKPLVMEEALFKLSSKGLRPVLAHPERYLFIQNDYSIIDDLLNANVLLQVNANALLGYYSKGAKKLAEHLVNESKVHFLGSDIHNQKHLDTYKKVINNKYFQKCRQLNLYNNTLSL